MKIRQLHFRIHEADYLYLVEQAEANAESVSHILRRVVRAMRLRTECKSETSAHIRDTNRCSTSSGN